MQVVTLLIIIYIQITLNTIKQPLKTGLVSQSIIYLFADIWRLETVLCNPIFISLTL